MNLTTRCPHCGTLFKLVRDQLRISDGWVRCGVCAEVFDAAVTESVADADADTDTDTDTDTDPGQPKAPPVTAPSSLLPAAADTRIEPVYQPLLAEVPSPATPAVDPEPEPLALKQALTDTARQRVASPGANTNTHGPSSLKPAGLAVPAPEPEFLVTARRRGFWRNRFVRGLMLLLSMALLGLLAIQVALKERDRLAAQFPQYTPYLDTLCHFAGCRLAPLRQIDAVVIDSSSFSKTESGTYQLSFVLKNTAETPLAVPALELTLTDRQDRPVLRRVVLPAEFGVGLTALQPRADFSGRLLLSLSNPEATDRIAGYRVLAFYP